MSGTDLVIAQYQALPGLAYLQALGSRVLAIALLVWLAVEMYQLLTRGTCDFVTPIVKVGLAIAIVGSLGELGSVLGATAESISRAMLDESTMKLFGEAFSHAVSQVYAESAWGAVTGAGIFNLKTTLLLFACALYLSMMLIKLLVIDVLWPICFGLTLVLGVLAVPLGVLPGGSVRGWFRSLVEVALWPIIFAFLVAMMVGSFGELLKEAASLDTISIFSQGISIDGAAAQAAKLSEGVFTLVRFWALCLGYCLLGLGTPVVAAAVMRSTPVGAALAASAFAAGRLLAFGKMALASTALGGRIAGGAAASGAGAAGGAGLASSTATVSAGEAGATAVARAAHASSGATPSLDQRRYAEPAKKEEEKKS